MKKIILITLADYAIAIYGILVWVGVTVLYHDKTHTFKALTEYFLFSNWEVPILFAGVLEIIQQVLLRIFLTRSEYKIRCCFILCFIIGEPPFIYALKILGIAKI